MKRTITLAIDKNPIKKLWLIVILTAGFGAGMLVQDYYLGKKLEKLVISSSINNGRLHSDNSEVFEFVLRDLSVGSLASDRANRSLLANALMIKVHAESLVVLGRSENEAYKEIGVTLGKVDSWIDLGNSHKTE